MTVTVAAYRIVPQRRHVKWVRVADDGGRVVAFVDRRARVWRAAATSTHPATARLNRTLVAAIAAALPELGRHLPD